MVYAQIDYINKDGDSVESFISVDVKSEDAVRVLHLMLDEYITKHNHDKPGIFWVGKFGGLAKSLSS